MTTNSYWQSTEALPPFPALKSDLQVDIIVVGGGMTGITTAYLLKQAGRKVALLERDRCVRGDSAATTAHLTCVTDQRLSQLVKTFGKDHAGAIWDAGMAAIGVIADNINRESIDCNFHRVPGYLHAPIGSGSTADADTFLQEAQLAGDMRFPVHFEPHIPLFNLPGIRVDDQAIFNPAAYLRGLLNSINGGGSHVFEHSEAVEFSQDPLSVRANGHTVTGNYVVIATHVPLMASSSLANATLFQSKLAPYSTYVVGAKIDKGSVPNALFWDTSDPYYYLRLDPHPDFDYVIFGGQDHKTGQVSDNQPHYDKLESLLHGIAPGAVVDRRWSGQVIETNDGLPLIGQLAQGQFVATGFTGNGMTFGTLSAVMACDAALGRKNPWANLFDVHRKTALRDPWDYLKENLDYPYYFIKDRLFGARNQGSEQVEIGQGKILQSAGKQLAAYRDEHGKLTLLSAVCTHMGCIVHWNQTEKTWDCPCHGSRFTCKGEVLSGPAEEPLPQASPPATGA